MPFLPADGLTVVEDLWGLTRVEGCMVPTPKPGPCPGTKRGTKKAATAVKKAAAPKKKTAAPKKTVQDGGKPALGQKIAKQKAVATPPDQADTPSEPKQAPVPRLSRKEATAMFAKMLADEPWTEEQEEALGEYTDLAYLNMNAMLRGTARPDPDPARTRQLIADANAGLRPLPQPIKVFRNAYAGLIGGVAKNQGQEAFLKGLRDLVGKQSQEAGFFSASIKPLPMTDAGGNQEFGDVRVEVDFPEGTPVAYLHGNSASPHEDEMVGGPGLVIEWGELDESNPEEPILRGRAVTR